MTLHNTASARRKLNQNPADDAQIPAVGQRLSRAQSRRRKIFRALHDCIIETGYSNTTLAHIAGKADMTPSHLLYYFQGKERILEEYFANVAQWFLKCIDGISREPVEDQVGLWTELWFGDGETAYADIGFMLECFGEAVHDGVMRETKSNFDRSCKKYLEQMFPADSLRESMGAGEAAEIGYALLIGLRSSVYFDKTMTLAAAASCFRAAISTLQTQGSAADR